ncbi:MAG: hypothetical protein ACXVAS_06345 [Vulcanimicrobiaceae bacterium]
MRRAFDVNAAPILEAHQAPIDCELPAAVRALRFLHAHAGRTLHLVGVRKLVDEFDGAVKRETVPDQIFYAAVMERTAVQGLDALDHGIVYTRQSVRRHCDVIDLMDYCRATHRTAGELGEAHGPI